jgi:L-serine dehydratase
MADAAVCQMMGGSARECIDATSLALQRITSLACNPVANRVEVPCLNINILGGMNAISSANVILAGYDKVIPLDETIRAIYDIGTKLPQELRCTYGGLGRTPASNAIRQKLEEK